MEANVLWRKGDPGILIFVLALTYLWWVHWLLKGLLVGVCGCRRRNFFRYVTFRYKFNSNVQKSLLHLIWKILIWCGLFMGQELRLKLFHFLKKSKWWYSYNTSCIFTSGISKTHFPKKDIYNNTFPTIFTSNYQYCIARFSWIVHIGSFAKWQLHALVMAVFYYCPCITAV